MNEQSELIPPTPGEQLARERRRRKMSVREVSRALRLPRSIIEAIESDNLESLASIYRRGYVANYARYLGVDPEPLVKELGAGEEAPLKPVLPTRPSGVKFERFLRIATYILVTTVIVPPLIWFFVQGGSRIFEREIAQQPTAEIGDSERSGGRVSERIAQALALDEPASDKSGNSHISASTVPLQAIRPLRGPESGAVPRETEDPAAGAPHDPRVELELKLNEDSWVEITGADGERLEFGLLRAGMSKIYRGKPPFDVLLGRANAVQMRLGGEAIRFEGDERADVSQFQLAFEQEPES